jgi:hypothetical protein
VILEKFSKKLLNTKFHGNPSGGVRADTCGRTDRRTDMKPTGAFDDYANVPKKNILGA